jgi:5-formyltetrahydrofolate cyclo-ligase
MDREVALWRRQQRAALLAQRKTMEQPARQHAALVVAEKLDAIVALHRPATIGLYWPIRNEINLLSWANTLVQRGGITLCLPVVVTRDKPLEYWRWSEGDSLARGFWNIPVPERREVVRPDLMLAPLVGFDEANYRLGYGGGYFDRTLASLTPRPMVAGVGFAFSALKTIFPQPHDIPMDAILTEGRDTTTPPRRAHAD